ncbi:MAG: TonB-dependent receptor [Pseudomonadota bacterium]
MTVQPALSEETEDDAVDTGILVVEGQATAGLDSLIDEQELQNYQVNDLDDMFRRDASISAGGSVGISQKIYLRNFGEDTLNISVDGAEQAGSVFHHAGRIAVEPELIKQVEIEAGAGSATAGPGALGGTVRFTTKNPEDLLDADEDVGVLLKTMVQSNGSGNKNSATVFGQSSDGSIGGIVSVLASDFDNIDDGDGDEVDGTESEKSLGFLKLVAKVSNEHEISFSHEALEEEGDMPYRPEWAVISWNDVNPTEVDRTTSIFNYGYTPSGSELVDLSVNVYDTQHEQIREFADVPFDAYVEHQGVTVENTSVVGSHKLIYGINHRDDKAFLEDAGTEEGTVQGLYIQDIIEVNERLTVTAGVRHDDYELDDNANDLSYSDDGVSPNVSANYKVTDSVSVSAGYAQAFRGPEIQDAYNITADVREEGLSGETATNLELGMDYSSGPVSLGVGVYQAVIEDAIGPENGVPWASTFVNLEDDIETVGFHAQFDYLMDKANFFASLNVAETEIDGEAASRYIHTSTANSIGDTLVLGVDYAYNDDLSFGWSVEYVAEIKETAQIVDGTDVYDLEYEKPSYRVHDVYANWQPSSLDGLTVIFSIHNVFDEFYLSQAATSDWEDNPGWEGVISTPETGRNARVSLAYRF